MSRRELAGFGVVACVARCAAPLLGLLGGVGALGLVSALFLGFGALVVALAAAVVVLRHRRTPSRTADVPVPVDLTRGPRWVYLSSDQSNS